MSAIEGSATVEENKRKQSGGTCWQCGCFCYGWKNNVWTCFWLCNNNNWLETLKWKFPFQVLLWCTCTAEFVGWKSASPCPAHGNWWLLQFPRVMWYYLSVLEEEPLGYSEWYSKLSYLLYSNKFLTLMFIVTGLDKLLLFPNLS